jgi:hypothetical protein
MPIFLPPRRPETGAKRESFLLKSILVASALVMGSLLVASQEFNFSSHGKSLSETEAALRLAAR